MSELLEQLRKVRTSASLALKPCPLLAPTFKLYPYQIPMVVNMLMVKSMVNGDDTGLGKSLESACLYTLRRYQDPTLNCLVVSPKNAIFQWRDEFVNVAPSVPVTVIRTQRPKGCPIKSDPEWRKHQYNTYKTGVMVCNYNQLYKEWRMITKALGKFIVIYDEATKFKALDTTLHGVIKQVSAAAQSCYALTATVIKGHLYEAFGICDGLNIAPWGSKLRFDGLYPVWKKQNVRIRGRRCQINVVSGWQNLDRFRQELEPFYYSRTVEEVASQLPPVITKNIILEMPEANRRKYEEAVDGLLQMPDGEIKESKTLTKLHYCQLISNSPPEMGFHDLEDSKVDAMQELLDNELEDQKVIIYSKYKRMVDYLENYFTSQGVPTLKVTGDVSEEDRYKAKNLFRDPKYRIILLNNAGNESMNLQVARGIICFDLPWSFGDYKQLVGRARRQGGVQQNILVYHLMHKDAIECYVYELLQQERQIVEGATGKVNQILIESTGDFAEKLFRLMKAKSTAA